MYIYVLHTYMYMFVQLINNYVICFKFIKMDERMDGRMDKQMIDRWIYRQMDEWTDRWMGGWIDVWMER